MPPLLDALALRARGGHCALVIRAGSRAAASGAAVAFQSTVSEMCGLSWVAGWCGLAVSCCKRVFTHVTQVMRARRDESSGELGAMRAQAPWWLECLYRASSLRRARKCLGQSPPPTRIVSLR